MTWKPSPDYDKVAEANRLYYAATASLYDTTETCVRDTYSQKALEADLDAIIGQLGGVPSRLTALDACGGSGNVALKLMARGVGVTLCDISDDLLAVFRSKAANSPTVPRIICSEIGTFFANDVEKYDCIIFSSALHHLEDIESVLSLAFDHLKPGGILFTIFDPTLQQSLKSMTKLALRLDYLMFKILHQSADFPAALRRRLQRSLGNRRQNKLALDMRAENLGVLAEYHVERGINDLALLKRLQAMGFTVLTHERYAGGRFALTRWLVRSVGDVTNFKFLLRKPIH